MAQERVQRLDLGRKWVGEFLVNEIKKRMSSGTHTEGDARNHCIKLTDLIIWPLVSEETPPDTLEHLQIEFADPQTKTNLAEPIDGRIRRITEILTDKFGGELVKHLKLSLVEEKIRCFSKIKC